MTCVFGPPDPDFDRLGFGDVVDALDEAPAQSMLAIKQDFPDEIAGHVGLTGGNTTAAIQSVGCVGCVADDPGRDIDEIRPMEFQYLLTGTTPAHGEMTVHAVNVPVSLRGMDVAPGEIIHMDETGAIKFPADRIDDVLSNVKELVAREDDLQGQLSAASSADEVRAALEGEEYGENSG